MQDWILRIKHSCLEHYTSILFRSSSSNSQESSVYWQNEGCAPALLYCKIPRACLGLDVILHLDISRLAARAGWLPCRVQPTCVRCDSETSAAGMESIKAVFWKPDPAAQVHMSVSCRETATDSEQMRKCNSLIRSNTRKLDRDMAQLKILDSKTKQYILQASKRGQKNPSQAKQAAAETRTFAREMIRIRKQGSRLATSKAQLQSVQMQVNEAFSVRKIEGSIKASTGIMKDVNSLVRLPELTGTMRELSQELVKAGIIEEMVGDSLPDDQLMEGEDDEAEAEVDKVLGEILQGKLGQAKVAETRVDEEHMPEEDLEEQEATLAQMRGRLEALKS